MTSCYELPRKRRSLTRQFVARLLRAVACAPGRKRSNGCIRRANLPERWSLETFPYALNRKIMSNKESNTLRQQLIDAMSGTNAHIDFD